MRGPVESLITSCSGGVAQTPTTRPLLDAHQGRDVAASQGIRGRLRGDGGDFHLPSQSMSSDAPVNTPSTTLMQEAS